MEFTDHDITQLADRLVDALAAWGDLEAIRARIAQHHAVGADQVALWVHTGDSARTYYDTIRARGTGHHAALRQLGNRLAFGQLAGDAERPETPGPCSPCAFVDE